MVTANTENQLKTKTWAELAKWHRLSFNKEDFVYAATALFSKSAAANPVKGGTLRLGMEGGSASDSLDPRTYADSVMIAASLACMNGLIEFDSRPGRTVFTLLLPFDNHELSENA